MATEKVQTKCRYLDYWLAHTTEDVDSGKKVTSYYVHESEDIEPDLYVNEENEDEVDLEFWTPVTEKEFLSVEKPFPFVLRRVTYTPESPDETEKITWAYFYSAREGERELEFRVAGICTECRWFKENADAYEKFLEEMESGKDSEDDPGSGGTGDDDVSAGDGDTRGEGDVGDGNEDQPESGEDDKEDGPLDEPQEDLSSNTETKLMLYCRRRYGGIRRCHCMSMEETVGLGMCTKFVARNWVSGDERNGNCLDHNGHGQCDTYEFYDPQKIYEDSIPKDDEEDVEDTGTPGESDGTQTGEPPSTGETDGGNDDQGTNP